jgi:hypothetical protein
MKESIALRIVLSLRRHFASSALCVLPAIFIVVYEMSRLNMLVSSVFYIVVFVPSSCLAQFVDLGICPYGDAAAVHQNSMAK